jgi:hypothetical protein
MFRARVDLNRLIQDQPPDPQDLPNLLQDLQSNALFQHLLRQLHLRYLQLALDRHQSSNQSQYEFDAGISEGAFKMLQKIETVLSDAARRRTVEEEETVIEQ